jgi:anthranilate synthase/aminodeoxychorismate synthase-like glutamine amidotransferase
MRRCTIGSRIAECKCPAGYAVAVPAPRLLLLDFADSFVWNLAQAFQILGAGVTVVRSQQIDPAGIAAFAPDALVLSPGPGRPDATGIAAVRLCSGRIPVLGVCLGHQTIGAAFGQPVLRTEPCHGEATAIHHDGSGLFAGLPDPLPAARYHSLAVAPDPAAPLRVTARDDAGVVMGLAHRTAPTFGLQFHPESFLTPHGTQMLAQFLRRCDPAGAGQGAAAP